MIHWWVGKPSRDRTTVCFEPWQKPRARFGSRKTGLSPPQVIFTDRSKAVLLLWFIFICYHFYNVCLLHDFVATLWTVRIALCIIFYFVQASTVTTSLQQLLTLLSVIINVLFYVSHFRSYYSLFLSYNRSWGRVWDPVKPLAFVAGWLQGHWWGISEFYLSPQLF